MAKNRSRRLRKKLHIEEFQELGFSVLHGALPKAPVEDIDSTLTLYRRSD